MSDTFRWSCEQNRQEEAGRYGNAGLARMDSRSNNLPVALTVGSYRMHFRAMESVRLPAYAGSAWRGALGHALRRLFCVTRKDDCAACLLYRACGYAYVFETPPPLETGKLRKYPAAPHPFVLMPGSVGGMAPAGSLFVLGLSLFGRGNDFLPYFIHALAQAAGRGIGGQRHRLQLERVEQCAPDGEKWLPIYDGDGACRALPPAVPVPPPLPETVSVELETPLRVKREGSVLGPETFSFGAFFSNLLRRISLLTYFHGETPLETDFKGLVAAARAIEIQDRVLEWFDWKRYSSRQGQEMKLGGILGQFRLRGADIAPFWPYLWLGQFVHAGAVTTMGLGRYRLIMQEHNLPEARFGWQTSDGMEVEA